jgi:hypothetical protein
MRTDEEIRKHSGLGTTALAVRLKDFAGEKYRRTRNFQHADIDSSENSIDFLNARETDRQLGVDHRVNAKPIAQGCGFELMLRPVSPLGIIGDDVQKDIGIYQDHRSAAAACERHDLLGSHLNGRGTADPSKSSPAGR